MGDEPLLLDTCAFLDWTLRGPMKKAAVQSLEQAAREGRVFLSPLSVQETMRLAEKGRLKLKPTAMSWTQRAMRKMRLSEGRCAGGS
ncbi:MAG: PIN domain-containing protein [Polyangiaceae bacterium]